MHIFWTKIFISKLIRFYVLFILDFQIIIKKNKNIPWSKRASTPAITARISKHRTVTKNKTEPADAKFMTWFCHIQTFHCKPKGNGMRANWCTNWTQNRHFAIMLFFHRFIRIEINVNVDIWFYCNLNTAFLYFYFVYNRFGRHLPFDTLRFWVFRFEIFWAETGIHKCIDGYIVYWWHRNAADTDQIELVNIDR